MPTYLYVQVKGVEKPIRIKADKFEQNGIMFEATNGAKKVAEFKQDALQGWWIQDEEDSPSFIG